MFCKRVRESLLIFMLIATGACSQHWTKALSEGTINLSSVEDVVSVRVVGDYFIIPVKIRGKVFQFLFDSAAPTAISNEVNDEFKFPVIASSQLYDGEGNSSQVDYVRLESLFIGESNFIDQTAFVGNFRSNELIRDLKIDGIVGANLVKDGVWTIDFESKALTLSQDFQPTEKASAVPFRSDDQFNMFVDMKIGDAVVDDLKIDYGFNGSILIADSDFSRLEQADELAEVTKESDVLQSTFIGEPTMTDFRISSGNTVLLNRCQVDDVDIQSGSSGLIGTEVLSRYKVTVDFRHKVIYFEEQ